MGSLKETPFKNSKDLGTGLGTCITYGEKMYTKGVWSHQNPLDYVYPLFMFQFILVLLSSRLVVFILRPLKQPTFVCYILSGIILGPSVLGRSKTFQDQVFPGDTRILSGTLSLLGAGFFLLIVTVKMDTETILRAKNAWRIGLTCFLFPLITTLCACVIINVWVPELINSIYFLIYLTSFLSVSYFAVIGNMLTELDLLTSELGQVAMSAGILHELIAWSFLGLLVIVNRDNTRELFTAAICMILLVVFTFFVLKPGIRWLVRRTPEGKPIHEGYIIGILLLTAIMGLLTDFVGGMFILGPILMGLIIPAGPPLGSALVDKAETIINGFFMPFFYVRVGQLTNVQSISNMKTFIGMELVIFCIYFGKIGACLLTSLWFKKSLRSGFILGLMFNLRGVVDIIMIFRWKVGKFVDNQGFAVLVITQVLLTAIGSPLISKLYKPMSRVQDGSSVDNRRRTLQTTPPDSELRILCCVHDEDHAHSTITFLRAANPTEKSPICAYVVHLVELVGRATPMLVSYNQNRRRFKADATDRIMRAVTKYLKSSCVPVTVQPYTMIAPYRIMHENICKLAHGKFIPLVLLPFHKGHGVDTNAGSIRTFNNNVLSFSSCTVGIFVDRSFPHYLSSTHFSYDVVCFFLGGEDDREALALALRMSGNPGVSITLVRFHLNNELDQQQQEQRDHYEETQRILDKCSIDAFVKRNAGNKSVAIREVSASNSMEVVNGIRSIENNYDLVIVGKRRGASHSNLENEMMPWVEHEELGVIGDMIASPDFCGGMMSVLVVQYCLNGYNVPSNSKKDTSSLNSTSASNHPKDPRAENKDLEFGSRL